MKTFTIAAFVALAGLTALPAMANDNGIDTNTINGQSEFAVESALRDRGVAVSSVETWGNFIRAWVPNETGGTSMQFFDRDSLQPAVPFGG